MSETKSAQILLIFFILVNCIIGGAGQIFNNPHDYSFGFLSNELVSVESAEEEFESDEAIQGSIRRSSDQQWESTIGDPIRWTFEITKLFIKGANPFSITPNMFSNPIEKLIAYVILGFRMFLIGASLIQIFTLVKK